MAARDISRADTSAMDRTEELATAPRYQLPNFASVLPEYANAEQDFIKQAFSSTSFVTLGKVPAKLKTSQISRTRQIQMDDNRRILPEGKPKRSAHGMFQDFTYEPSEYVTQIDIERQDRLEAKAKRIADKDFMVTSSAAKAKHEDLFEDKEYRFPYRDDPYDSALIAERRREHINIAKRLTPAGFVPGGAGKALQRPTRLLLPDLVRSLTNKLEEDWDGTDFQLINTEDDFIELRFDQSTVDSERGLKAYMNTMAETGEIVDKYKLAKVADTWHYSDDGAFVYLFQPPWAKPRSRDQFVNTNQAPADMSTNSDQRDESVGTPSQGRSRTTSAIQESS